MTRVQLVLALKVRILNITKSTAIQIIPADSTTFTDYWSSKNSSIALVLMILLIFKV